MAKKNQDAQPAASESSESPLQSTPPPASLDLPSIPRKSIQELPPLEGTQARLRITPEEMAEWAAPQVREDQLFAERFAQQHRAARIAKEKQIAEQEDAGKVFYLLCSHCQGPSILFRHNPARKKITHADWYSSKKPLGAPWGGGKITCMNCGNKARVQYAKNTNTIQPVRRFLRWSKQETAVTR